MAHLVRSVSAGGVVYPAGTPATPALRKIIKAKFWSGDPTVSEAGDPSGAAQRKVRELSKQVQDLTAKVGELTTENETLRAEIERLTDDGTEKSGEDTPPAGDPVPDRYDGWRIDRLRNEAAAREIAIEDPNDKPGILAALRAADQAATTGD